MTGVPPLVTIVTPAFNCAHFIRATYDSIVAQTRDVWEWRVVDDASADDTFDILAQIARQDPRVIVSQLPHNSGAAVARNTAIAAARGRFIAFLDGDDIWHPQKLATQCDMMLQTGASLTYGAYDIISEDGSVRAHVAVPQQTDYRALLKHNVIGCLTAMYDTQTHGKVLMPLKRKRQDYGMWLALMRNGGSAQAVPGTLASYRRLPGSLSSNKLSAALGTWAVYRDLENLGLLPSLYYFIHYAFGALARNICRKQSLFRHAP
jgi:teichuronic acid biosynthesis glycosyltransferase TuaG